MLFHHSVYNGVYATAEERVMGGECLSLNKNVADWCGVPAESFSDNWDMGHMNQRISVSIAPRDEVPFDR